MNDFYADVLEFRKKMEISIGEKPKLLSLEEFIFNMDFLVEELSEFAEAHENSSLIDAADAIVDLIYVAIGTAITMGLPLNELWDIVHTANMSKEKVADASESKRNSTNDVKKPEGFVSPETKIAEVLKRYE